MADWVVGVDPARRQDHTGIGIVSLDDANLEYLQQRANALELPTHMKASKSFLSQRQKEERLTRVEAERPPLGFVLRNILRLAKKDGMGFDWDVQARLVARIMDRPELARATVATDMKGVGDSFVTMLRRSHGLNVVGIETVAGDAKLHRNERGIWVIGRNYLIGDLAVALHTGYLKTAGNLDPELEGVIRKESVNLYNKYTDAGNERVAHYDLGEHDDTVFGVAYAWAWIKFTNVGKVTIPPRATGPYRRGVDLPFKWDGNLPFDAKDFVGW